MMVNPQKGLRGLYVDAYEVENTYNYASAICACMGKIFNEYYYYHYY